MGKMGLMGQTGRMGMINAALDRDAATRQDGCVIGKVADGGGGRVP